MSNKANAARYSQRVNVPQYDLDLFGLKSKRRMKEYREMADVDVDVASRIAEMQHKYDKDLETLRSNLAKELAADATFQAFLTKNNIPKEQHDSFVQQVIIPRIENQGRIERLETKALSKESEVQPSVDAGVRARIAGLDLNKVGATTPANALTTMPSIPGLTAPIGTDIGLSTTAGPTEEKTASLMGGVRNPKTGEMVGGTPTLQTMVRPSARPITYPQRLDPSIKAKAMEAASSEETTPPPISTTPPSPFGMPLQQRMPWDSNLPTPIDNLNLNTKPPQASPQTSIPQNMKDLSWLEQLAVVLALKRAPANY